MVKGISKQVIVVNAPEDKLFEQAIFILHEKALGAEGVTDEQLLQQAKKLIRGAQPAGRKCSRSGPVWACGGAVLTGLAWLITTLL